MQFLGPKGIKTALSNVFKVVAPQSKNFEVVEFDSQHETLVYSDLVGGFVYKDSEATIYPMKSSDSEGKECHSFFIVPNNAKPKFLPHRATELGCDPIIHFKQLVAGQEVTLDNGTVVTPSMVQDPVLPSHAFAAIFLPNTEFIETFVESNQALFGSFQS